MTSFFDLTESKKKNLSLTELHNYAERLEINVYKVSSSTGKNIKKKKQELIDEIDEVYLKNKIKNVIEKNEKKKTSKTEGKYEPHILIKLSEDEYNVHNKEKDFNENKFKDTYLNKKFKVKIEYGSIIYYGTHYYFYNKDKVFVKLENDTNKRIIIPRVITKNFQDSIAYFEKLKDNDFKIGTIQLSNQDIYIQKYLEITTEDKLNGIHFNYTYIKNLDKYEFEIELNYLGQKNVINESYPTFIFFPKKDISLLQIHDFQNKLSSHQFSFTFKIYGPPDHFIDYFIEEKINEKKTDNIWKWSDNTLIMKSEINKGDTETNSDSFYFCSGFMTMYAKFENKKNVKNTCEMQLNEENIDYSYLIQDHDYFKFDENAFENCIQELGTDIINFDLKK